MAQLLLCTISKNIKAGCYGRNPSKKQIQLNLKIISLKVVAKL
ncbi:hypothetical protein [Bacillus mycoides]|nr:hypothetical protein [Bacillus mycoides]MCQ6356561.1 hypothetical protein [Bacillus cereus]